MDDRRFDNLTRFLATGTSRRQMLKGLAGTLLGGLTATAAAKGGDAFVCRGPGVLCALDGQCCSGICDTGSHHCVCPSGEIPCGQHCIAPCTALDQCHGVGQCDPAAGACTNPPLASGTPCGQGPRCSGGVATGQDVCNGAGTCITGATTTCAPYVCGATACLTSCSGSNQCINGDYCAGGQCTTLKPNGTSCASAGECQSGLCVDGVCCNSACGGQCEACNLSGAIGTCTAVSGQPVGGRAACASDGSVCGGSCDGSNTQSCTYPGSGTTCHQASCSNGTETLAATCDGAGHCPAAQTQGCGAYICGATACLTSCTNDNQCVSGAYCDTTSQTCKQDLPQGQACNQDHQCLSGHCVDGVCCNTACTDQCAACNVTGSVGTCSPAPAGAPVGGRALCNGEAPPNSGSGSVCGGSCDGTHTTCTYPGSSTTCGSATCTGDTFTPAPTCDGAGNCAPGTSHSCSPYLCGTNACQTSCDTFTDCATGFQCNGSKQCVTCTPLGQSCAESACCANLTCQVPAAICRANDGQPCQQDSDCLNGHCVSGVCCATACSSPCQTCSTGTCTNLSDGTTSTCPSGQSCQSGQCVTPCLALQAACNQASQCCQTVSTQCETVGGGTQTQCCRTPGISCNVTADCCGPGTCGTTGFGPNHCCLPDGNSCDPNNPLGDCCAGSACIGGVCCNTTCAAGECGDVAKCGALVDCGTCPKSGDVCNPNTNTCCTPNAKSVTCNGKCGPVTDNCGQTVQCSCDSLHNCVNGQCVDCMQLGGTCGYPDYASGCCQATGTTYCESNIISGTSNVCCHHVYGSCTGDVDCCGAAQCGGNGTCCYPLNFQDCGGSDQCCGGLVCADAICCSPNGGGCGADGDCCSGHCVFGTCGCSLPGSPCSGDSDCCSGSTCCSGYCRDLTVDGYNCGSCGNDCGYNGINVHKGCCFGYCC